MEYLAGAGAGCRGIPLALSSGGKAGRAGSRQGFTGGEIRIARFTAHDLTGRCRCHTSRAALVAAMRLAGRCTRCGTCRRGQSEEAQGYDERYPEE
ncbi:hypothetical protein ASZ90_015989 [hydrocarbon metagenome]|uniref:Uncharacterized protein n=1 Tax=hydrocarbon metagenome TaxID=938273 RepID=A0A0W8F0E1_9ZZZZ